MAIPSLEAIILALSTYSEKAHKNIMKVVIIT